MSHTQDGIASPNPSYPSEVKVVTGDNTINIVSKNQIGPLSDFIANNSSLQVTTTSTLITVTHTTTQAWIGIYKELDNLIPNSTMTLSVKGVTTTTTGYSMTVRNSGGQVVQEVIRQASGSRASFSFTVPSDGKIIIRLYAGYGDVQIGDTATYSELQLEKGTTVTSYEPYQSQSHKIYLGVENLWKEIPNATKQEVTCTYNDDGSYTLNGTAIANASFYITVNYPAGTYTLSANNLETIGGGNYLLIETSGGNSGRYTRTMDVVDAKTTFTTTYTLQAVVIVVSSGTTFNNFTFKPQLEKGSIKHDFWKYGIAPIELCKIVDYKDKIYNNDNDKKWYLRKEIGKMVFNGTENWSLSTISGFTRFASPSITDTPYSTSRSQAISNYFHYASGSEVGAGFIYAQQFFAYPNQDVTTVEGFKSWLTTHNTTIYYDLLTPTTTEITNEALIEQLEAVKLLSGTQNNFTIDADTLPTLNLNYIGEASPHL